MSIGTYSVENAARYNWGSVSGEIHPVRLALLREHLAGQRILDAGCGGGAFVDLLSRQGLDAVGVDLYPEFLQVAAEKQYQGTFLQGSVTDLPFDDKSFDTSCCFDVLEHVDDVAALRELARVTRKRILASVPRQDDEMVPYGLTFRQYQDQTHLRYYTPEMLEALGAEVGATRVQVIPELPVPARELVHHLMMEGFGSYLPALRETIAELLAGAEAETPHPAPAPPPPVPTPPKVTGVRSSLVSRMVTDARVQQIYEDAYQASLESSRQEFHSYYETLHQQALQRFSDKVYFSSLERFLEQSSFRVIPTGLAVVIDLEG